MKEKERAVMLIDYENLKTNHREKLDFIFNHPETPKDFVVNNAYDYFKRADTKRDNQFKQYKIEQVPIISYNRTGKNGADIRMVVDAMELLYTNTFNHFVFVTGDSDFIHLYKHLRFKDKEITVFAEKESLGQYTKGYSKVILIPKQKAVSKTKADYSKTNILSKENQEILLKNILTILRYFSKTTKLPFFIWAVNYAHPSFNFGLFGCRTFEEMALNFETIFIFNPENLIIKMKSEYILPFEKISKAYHPLLIEVALNRHDRNLHFPADGLHNKVFEVMSNSLKPFSVGQVVNIYEFLKPLSKMSNEINRDEFKTCLSLLIHKGVIEFAEENRSFKRLTNQQPDEIIKALQSIIRHICYKAPTKIEKRQWQSILDKSFAQKETADR